jgi:hypothetical protein
MDIYSAWSARPSEPGHAERNMRASPAGWLSKMRWNVRYAALGAAVMIAHIVTGFEVWLVCWRVVAVLDPRTR